MTDLERVRDFVLAMAEAEMLDIIDAHLKEDAAQVARRRALRHRAQRAEAELVRLREALSRPVFKALEDSEAERDRLREELDEWKERAGYAAEREDELRGHHHQHHEGTDEW